MEKQEKPDVVTKPVDVKVAENPDNVPVKEVVSEKAEEAPAGAAAAEESPVVTPASEETSEVSPTVTGTETNSATENSSEAAPEESSDSTENSGDQEAVEETPEIKVSLHIQLSEIFFFCWLPKGTCLIFIFLDFFICLICSLTFYFCVQIETAPADFRFPTTNQTRHCFTRYVEYHR